VVVTTRYEIVCNLKKKKRGDIGDGKVRETSNELGKRPVAWGYSASELNNFQVRLMKLANPVHAFPRDAHLHLREAKLTGKRCQSADDISWS
jgi:hypothetical protein